MYWEVTGSICGWVDGVNGSVETPTSSSTLDLGQPVSALCGISSPPQLFCNYMENTLIPLKDALGLGRAVWRENEYIHMCMAEFT